MNEIIETLEKIGFIHQYNTTYIYQGYQIKIRESVTLEDIFKELIKMGATLKVWEVKNVLQIIS